MTDNTNTPSARMVAKELKSRMERDGSEDYAALESRAVQVEHSLGLIQDNITSLPKHRRIQADLLIADSQIHGLSFADARLEPAKHRAIFDVASRFPASVTLLARGPFACIAVKPLNVPSTPNLPALMQLQEKPIAQTKCRRRDQATGGEGSRHEQV